MDKNNIENVYRLDKTDQSYIHQERKRNKELMLLSDEELEILEILAKKANKKRLHKDADTI
jgi:hypothetical protein